MSQHKPVIVVGGGWAGLAAAVELSRYDIPVTVLESAKQLGGRARRVPFTHNTGGHNYGIDNGQHILIGAYDSTLSLLRTIGIREEDVLRRRDLYMHMLSPKQKTVKLKTGKLPAPLHLLAGLISVSGLPITERFSAIRFCYAMAKQKFRLTEDMTCLSVFKQHHQSERLIKTLWEPLCLAALNTHINEASAKVFLRTLSETFSYERQNSNFLFATTDMGKLLPDPALDYIEKNHGSIKLAHRVTQLNLENNTITGVTTENKSLLAPYVILATPFHITEQLIAEYTQTHTLSQQLKQFRTNPIVTVYLQYPESVSLGMEMVGMVDTTSQWLLDRVICHQPGLISVVISGSGPHMNMDNDELSAHIIAELKQQFPDWPEPIQTRIIREKRATFHCCPDIDKIRPPNHTAIEGLLLAGDYTNTDLPATLESAVRSGRRAAKTVLKMQTAAS